MPGARCLNEAIFPLSGQQQRGAGRTEQVPRDPASPPSQGSHEVCRLQPRPIPVQKGFGEGGQKAAAKDCSCVYQTRSNYGDPAPSSPKASRFTYPVFSQQTAAPRSRERVPFQVHSSALPLCFKPQELNYNSKVKTSSANSSGDVP